MTYARGSGPSKGESAVMRRYDGALSAILNRGSFVIGLYPIPPVICRGALRRAADAAPGPLSALAASIMTFAARALRHRRLAFAAIAEPVDAELDATRLAFRLSLAAEFAQRITAAVKGTHLPEQDSELSAAALLGLLVEGLIGPLAPDAVGREHAVVQSLALIALRGLGVADARARGLVVQTVIADQ
jgi:hypothetical protein